MIAVLKTGTTDEQIENLSSWIKLQGLEVHISRGSVHTVIGLVGDTAKIDAELLESLDIVDSVKRISEPFKSANRKFHPDDSVISVGNTSVGGNIFSVIAGPCSVESEAQVMEGFTRRASSESPKVATYSSSGTEMPSRRRACTKETATMSLAQITASNWLLSA